MDGYKSDIRKNAFDVEYIQKIITIEVLDSHSGWSFHSNFIDSSVFLYRTLTRYDPVADKYTDITEYQIIIYPTFRRKTITDFSWFVDLYNSGTGNFEDSTSYTDIDDIFPDVKRKIQLMESPCPSRE